MAAVGGSWEPGRILFRVLLVATALVVAVVVVSFLRTGDVGPAAVMRLNELHEEKVVFLEDEQAYLVSFEGEVLALSTDAQHLGDHVEFCPRSELFESPAHGEKFDIRGLYFGGPARRGLDRFGVSVQEGWVYVDFNHRIDGPERDEAEPRGPVGPLCLY